MGRVGKGLGLGGELKNLGNPSVDSRGLDAGCTCLGLFGAWRTGILGMGSPTP